MTSQALCTCVDNILITYDENKATADIPTHSLNNMGGWAVFREWVVENEIKINPGKSKAVSFTKGRVNQLIPEASSFKYLGIIIRSDLNWADHVNYTL